MRHQCNHSLLSIYYFSEPRYLADRAPILTPSGNILRVDWTQSFEINGEVLQFVVYVDQKADYYGYSTVYDIPRTSQYKSELTEYRSEIP